MHARFSRCASLGLAAPLLGAAPGCQFEAPDGDGRPDVVDVDRRLADLGRLTAHVGILQAYGFAEHVLVAQLDYPGLAKLARDGAECAKLADLVARVGDVEVPVRSLGGWSDAVDPICEGPSLQIDLTAAHHAARTLTFGDGSRTLEIDVGDRLAPRAITLVDPPAGGYRKADTIKARWSHELDLLVRAPNVTLFPADAPNGVSVPRADVRVDRDALSFPASAAGGLTGTVSLAISTSRSHASCDDACSVFLLSGADVPVQLRD
jgi:hypothetical protein